MTDGGSCDCACHTADVDAAVCPDCVEQHATQAEAAPEAVKRQSPLEELRAMPRPQKLILAAKADRATRVLLIRDVDPQVLFYVCKNPRITLDEILEITKLGTLNAQVADLIATSAQWMQNEQVSSIWSRTRRRPRRRLSS